MIRQAYRGLASFARRDVVLTIAILLAVLSAFFVPPSPAYLSYIDWDTLCLLFSLMAVMKGFQQEGFFQSMGSALLRRAASTRRMVLVLVFLPFFCSMAITNDVSLITFVPFGLAVLKLAPTGGAGGAPGGPADACGQSGKHAHTHGEPPKPVPLLPFGHGVWGTVRSDAPLCAPVWDLPVGAVGAAALSPQRSPSGEYPAHEPPAPLDVGGMAFSCACWASSGQCHLGR